jgi:hypothetical protein
MRRLVRRLLLGVWILSGHILLVRFWYTYPDSYPGFLKIFGNWCVDFFRPISAEQAADIELLSIVGVSLAIVLCATWFALFLLKRLITSASRNPPPARLW